MKTKEQLIAEAKAYMAAGGRTGRPVRGNADARWTAKVRLMMDLKERYQYHLGSPEAAEDYGSMCMYVGEYLAYNKAFLLHPGGMPNDVRSSCGNALAYLRENLATLRDNGCGNWGHGHPHRGARPPQH